MLCCSVDSKDDSHDKVHGQDVPGSSSSTIAASAKADRHKLNTTKSSSSTRPLTAVQSTKAPIASTTKSSAKEPKVTVAETTVVSNGTTAIANGPKKVVKKDFSDDEEEDHETATIANTANTNDETPVTHPDDEEEDDDIDEDIEEEIDEDDLQDDEESYLDLIKLQEGQAFNPETGFLLGVKDTKKYGKKKCLVLDLDETLVHSSFKYLRTADFVIPVEIDNQVHHVYVIKRPGVDEFLLKVGQWFEVVVFTASVLKYGDPLLDKLDVNRSVHHRLFRDSCYNYQGNFIKNLSQLGRPLSDSIIIDNSPASYIFHPQHSIPISSWFSDTHDNELLDLLPFLEDLSKQNVDDVGLVLDITL